MSKELDIADNLISVAKFSDPATGNMARSALESAEIPVFLQGENANSLLPIAFETKLFVREEDETRAREILAEFMDAPVSLADVTAAEEAEG